MVEKVVENKIERIIKPKRKVYAVELFCGAGGLTHGLEKAGIDVRLGFDIEPACEFPYTANNKGKFILKSVEDVKGKDINEVYRKNSIRLLAGCAPCQTFSRYNQKASDTDKRWWLLQEFSRLIKEVGPELVTMENVPELKDHKVFTGFIEDLRNLNYYISYEIVNCAKYGVPQHRNRLVLLASKFGPIKLLPPSSFGQKEQTVREAIGHLRPIGSGEVDQEDILHQSAALNEINLKRIRASRPGGTWRDWEVELQADCHRKDTGKSYPSVYGRMVWDEPAPTMTTQFFGYGNGRFGHPEQDRAISLREGAIFQSFPEDYLFIKPGETVNKTKIGRMIGNAVPVRLGEVIGLSIHSHVSKNIKIVRSMSGGS